MSSARLCFRQNLAWVLLVAMITRSIQTNALRHSATNSPKNSVTSCLRLISLTVSWLLNSVFWACFRNLRPSILPGYRPAAGSNSCARRSGSPQSSCGGTRCVWFQHSGSLPGYHPEDRPHSPRHGLRETENQSRGPGVWLSVKKRPGSQWVGIGRLNHASWQGYSARLPPLYNSDIFNLQWHKRERELGCSNTRFFLALRFLF